MQQLLDLRERASNSARQLPKLSEWQPGCGLAEDRLQRVRGREPAPKASQSIVPVRPEAHGRGARHCRMS